jgi:hypothetical protein
MSKGHVKPTPKTDPRGSAAGRRMRIAGPQTDELAHRSPLLPHEHDESPEVSTGPRANVVRRAQRDLAEGRVDTEARSTAVRHFERAAHNTVGPTQVVRANRGRKDHSS